MRFCSKLLLIAIIAGVGVFSSIEKASANGLSVSGTSLQSPDAASNTIKIEFDLSWSNSWRNQTNHDAVWVFAKYSTDSGATWSHATLKNSGLNPGGFSAGSGTALEIFVPTDRKGAFIHRSSMGSGDVSVSNIELVWDYAADGLSDSSTVRVKVLGVEMVYIPTAPFYLGDGDTVGEALYALHVSDNTAFQVSSVAVSSVSSDANALDDIDSSPITIDGDGGVSGNANWPVGYNAYYVMKHEITEGQWVEFYNTLTSLQKLNRDITNAVGKNSDGVVNRNSISWTSGDAATSRSDRACNFLSWMDGCAYADWAGLRPMTETEFEKVARGTESPDLGEYVWGNTTIAAADTIAGSENGAEFIGSSTANASFGGSLLGGGDGGSGPLRAGIFATSESSRVNAGASFYGVLDLSGNVSEQCVFLGNVTGRSFSGSHGDGLLTTSASYEGNATNSDWPGIDGTSSRGVTGANGSGLRGGSWSSASTTLQSSDRSSVGTAASNRSNASGFRCVRTVS